MPPAAVAIADPLLFPQAALVLFTLNKIAVGCDRLTVLTAVHPDASVTLTIYIPLKTVLICWVSAVVTAVAPVLQLYVYGPVLPVIETEIFPVPPLQFIAELTLNVAPGDGLLLIAATVVLEQRFASVTVTV